jgi:uncharacterized protein YaiI (UPF0178 family)
VTPPSVAKDAHPPASVGRASGPGAVRDGFCGHSEGNGLLHIFVDADACPVKQEVYRVASRYHLGVTLVANSRMRVPNESWITLEVVGGGFDEADDWIVEHVQPHDIVITADVLLASRCLKAGARVIGSSGKPFTEGNIGSAVATRDLLSDLRGAGEITGGPPPLTRRDRSLFLQKLDETIQSIRRLHPATG